MKLDAKTVAALTLPAGKRDVIYFDDELPGFGYRLRLGSGGQVRRSWVAQYRRAGGTRRLLLGSAAVLSVEKARLAARKVLAAVTLGQDPQADRVDRRGKDQLKLRGVVDEFLKAKQTQLRRRSFIEIKRYLTGKYFKPLHALPVDAVTRKDIAALLVTIVRESGTTTAARARSALSACYVWCMQMGLVEQNPIVGTIQPEDSQGRDRVLSDTELAALWRGCGDDEYGRVVRLLILTGCRRQEVGGMRWSELHDDGLWTLPAERAKNGREHILPLPPAAWHVIQSVPRMANRDHLFGVHAANGFTNWAVVKEKFDERLGATVEPYVLHDVRRSVATGLANLGVQPHVIEQILNHQGGSKRGVAGTYNRATYQREVKAALALWADHLRALVEGSERKVLMIPTAAS